MKGKTDKKQIGSRSELEAISREGRKVEGGTKSAKALFLFLPACFERDIERWREVEEPFHCGPQPASKL